MSDDDLREELAAAKPEVLHEGDFYWDGPYMVFTAAYHLRRGSCCHSGCRHCPYGEAEGGADLLQV
jgi:hypothetical protein